MVVAVDSSTVIAFIQGERGPDVDKFDAALSGSVALPPVVLTELLSEPRLPKPHREMLLSFPLLELKPDFWARAAAIRSVVLSKKLRARLPDTLIAQACIDNDVALITRDGDFRHFAKHCGLTLA